MSNDAMPAKRDFKARNGVVYTPQAIADALVSLVYNLKPGAKRVLEPSAGDGVFLTALTRSGMSASALTAVDKSRRAINLLEAVHQGSSFYCTDFIDFSLKYVGDPFDIVIGNPPFVRRSAMVKSGLKNMDRLKKAEPSVAFSPSNLWAAFLIAANRVAAGDAVLAFVLPYELLSTCYGQAIQQWVLKHVGSLDIVVSKSRAFHGIDQDAVIAIIDKGDDVRSMRLHYVDELKDVRSGLNRNSSRNVDPDSSLSMQRFLLPESSMGLLDRLSNNLPTMSSVCSNSTGIVTAANQYFIQPRHELERLGISEYGRPIIRKTSDLLGRYTLTPGDDELEASLPYVLDFGSRTFEDLSFEAVNYIDLMKRAGVANRYKCRKRPLWYQVPMLDVAPLYFFKRSHLQPKIVYNEIDARVTDTAYRVYPQNGFTSEGIFYSFYNSLTALFAELNGRFYGGGVLEITPNEFRRLPIAYEQPDEREFDRFHALLLQHEPGIDAHFKYGDLQLQRRLQLSDTELVEIQTALRSVRKHRLRHSGAVSSRVA